MELLNISWWDYILFFVMIGFNTAVGIYHGCFGTKQSTTHEYLFGGSRMKVLPVSMSQVASTLSGISLLGIPAEIYMYGTQFWVMIFSTMIVGFVINLVYLPVFHKLKLQNTHYYLEMRYNKSIRSIASLLYVIRNVLYLGIVIYVPSLALSQVIGLNLYVIAPILSLICIFYTSIGGMKTVVWVDTLNITITFFSLSFILIMGTALMGGFKNIWQKAEQGDRIEFFNFNIDPTLRLTFWSVFIGQIFSWTACTAIDPVTVQRLLAVPSVEDSKKMLLIFVVMTVITKSINCFSGLILYAKYFNCDPLSAGHIQRADQILPYYVLDVASQIPGLSGLFIAGLFSTALSVLSGSLNVLSGVIYTNFLQPLLSESLGEGKSGIVMKIVTALVGVLIVCLVFVMEKLGSVLELTFSLGGITSGPLLGLYTMGMIFPFVNTMGAIWGGLGSLTAMSIMIIRAQMYLWNGIVKYDTRPLNVDGCNTTVLISSFDTTHKEKLLNEPPSIFRISFHYYPVIGFLITILIGCIVSWITGNNKNNPINSDLLCPFVHKYISNDIKNQHELQELTTSDTKPDKT